jgi:hypothetical protein
MMGDSDPQSTFFYSISLETFVPQEHPLRRIRPLVDAKAIRKACRSLYSSIGRPCQATAGIDPLTTVKLTPSSVSRFSFRGNQ